MRSIVKLTIVLLKCLTFKVQCLEFTGSLVRKFTSSHIIKLFKVKSGFA